MDEIMAAKRRAHIATMNQSQQQQNQVSEEKSSEPVEVGHRYLEQMKLMKEQNRLKEQFEQQQELDLSLMEQAKQRKIEEAKLMKPPVGLDVDNMSKEDQARYMEQKMSEIYRS